MQRVGTEVEGRDHEHRPGRGVRHEDHSKIPPISRLAEGDTRAVAVGLVLQRPGKYVSGLLLGDAVTKQVRLARLGIEERRKSASEP